MSEKYLPLGSVVLLKGAKKRVMVIGFMCTSNETGDKIFDYMGCLYPEGVINSQHSLMFNHDQIERIDNVGFSDVEEKSFKNKLNDLVVRAQADNSSEGTGVSVEIPAINSENQ